MARWDYAEYRDFDGVPRTMVCSCALGTFLFQSPMEPATGEHADFYAVYRLPPLSESETCASWFGIETRAIEDLGHLPVEAFPFDADRREFLPYDPIEWLLRGGSRRG